MNKDKIKVDYLGRSQSDFPCFLFPSGKLSIYLQSCEQFIFYQNGTLVDAGEIVYSTSSNQETTYRNSCVLCNTHCEPNTKTSEITVLAEELTREEVCPRSLRTFLHEIFHTNGHIKQKIILTEHTFCASCVEQIQSEFEYIINQNSSKLLSQYV